MLLKPMAILLMLVLGWALVPPTLFVLIGRLRGRMKTALGRQSKPPSERVCHHWFMAYFFIAVAFGWSSLFLFFPLLKSLVYSFTDKSLSPQAGLNWIGFLNYTTIIRDPLWWKSILITVVYITGTLPYSIFISLFLASLINSMSTLWQTFFKTALYIPGVVSVVVNAAILKWIFYPGDGFANFILRKAHLIQTNLSWFSDPRLAMPTLIAMSWLGVSGICVIIYCAALGGIPRDYYEAAEIDGASPVQKFFRITWPLVKPSTVYVIITGLIGGFQIFAPALLITGGGPQFTTHFVNYRIYQTFYYDNRFGMACSMCVVLMIIIVTISVINYKMLATDVEY
jgi:multiple sugar transport system permease protein